LKKTRKIWSVQKWDSERSGEESGRIQSQEAQEVGRPTAATTFITQTSSVTQSVDLTNKGMGNNYLRDVHDDFALHCAREDGIFDIVVVLLFIGTQKTS